MTTDKTETVAETKTYKDDPRYKHAAQQYAMHCAAVLTTLLRPSTFKFALELGDELKDSITGELDREALDAFGDHATRFGLPIEDVARILSIAGYLAMQSINEVTGGRVGEVIPPIIALALATHERTIIAVQEEYSGPSIIVPPGVRDDT